MKQQSFATVFAKLEKIVEQLEDERTSLDDGFRLIETAQPLLKQAAAQLKDFTHQFETLAVDFMQENENQEQE